MLVVGLPVAGLLSLAYIRYRRDIRVGFPTGGLPWVGHQNEVMAEIVHFSAAELVGHTALRRGTTRRYFNPVPMRRPDHREAILQAALRLSSTEGLDAIPTAEVCREAGVSNGTMFHYFPTKAALHSALYLRAMSGYQEAIVSALKTARSARSGIRGIVLAHARWVIAHAEEARFLHEGRRGHGAELLEQEIRAQNEDFLRTVSAWLEPHVKAEAIKRYPKSVLIALLFGPAHTLTRDWMRTGDARSLLEAAPILADAAWASLARAARGDESR